MKDIKAYLLLLVSAAIMATGCDKSGISGGDDAHNVLLAMNVGATDVSGSAYDDGKITSLRVYAFTGDRQVGYFKAPDGIGLPVSFLMDISLYSTTVQTVDFYAIANEDAMSGGTVLLDNMSRADLDAAFFTGMSDVLSNGIPMSCRTSVELDVEKEDPDGPAGTDAINRDEHTGHTLLGQSVEFSLERCVSRISLYAAKEAGETKSLHVNSAVLRKEGVKSMGYIMPQGDAVLRGTASAADVVTLPVDTDKAVGAFAGSSQENQAQRENPANYTDVLGSTFYVFENPDGSSGWNAAGPETGAVLDIRYTFEAGLEMAGTVYMPPLKRNCHYNVMCIMTNEGKIIVNYTVADWDDEDQWMIDFDYPTYSNPVLPEDYTADQPKEFGQPTVFYDPNNPMNGSYAFLFNISAPEGQLFVPVLNAPETDFAVKVYRDGVELPSPDQWVASQDTYVIRVFAKSASVTYQDGTPKRCYLGITYTPTWLDETSFLLINGRQGNLAYEGSATPEIIVIEQIEK